MRGLAWWVGLGAVVVLGAAGCLSPVDEQGQGASQSDSLSAQSGDAHPTGRGFVPRDQPDAALRGAGGKGTGIYYHGGPVMTATKNVYFIWWGQWGSDTATTILPDEIKAIGGTPWFNINSTYYDSNAVHVSNSVALAGQIFDTSLASNATITDADVTNEVNTVLNDGQLPRDANGFYMVLTPADVADSSGFCSQWCGWHDFLTNGVAIKYAYIPNDARCPTACSAVSSGPTPNGNLGADAMASVIGHELSEASTDPQLNAWYDHRGFENADKCAWNFGTTSTDSNGATYNVTWGSRNFLVQQNWVDAGSGGCALHYP